MKLKKKFKYLIDNSYDNICKSHTSLCSFTQLLVLKEKASGFFKTTLKAAACYSLGNTWIITLWVFLLIFTDSRIWATVTFHASDLPCGCNKVGVCCQITPAATKFVGAQPPAPPTSDLQSFSLNQPRCKADTLSRRHVCGWFLPSDFPSLESQNNSFVIHKTCRRTGGIAFYRTNIFKTIPASHLLN